MNLVVKKWIFEFFVDREFVHKAVMFQKVLLQIVVKIASSQNTMISFRDRPILKDFKDKGFAKSGVILENHCLDQLRRSTQ